MYLEGNCFFPEIFNFHSPETRSLLNSISHWLSISGGSQFSPGGTKISSYRLITFLYHVYMELNYEDKFIFCLIDEFFFTPSHNFSVCISSVSCLSHETV